MLTGKEIVKDSDPILRKRAEMVQMPPSKEDQETLRLMHEFVVNSQDEKFVEKHQTRAGIGLAAPQISISKRMIAIHVPQGEDEPISYMLFNPRIISHSSERIYIDTGEGCLSVDQQYPGFVSRYAKIRVKANNIDGEEIQLTLTGLTAICIQHEIDHLNGILFYDHINKQDPFAEIENATLLVRS